MIRYDLICDKEHQFDGWFRNSAAFEEQASAAQVACPTCGSTAVSKQLMTPGIPAKSNRRAEATVPMFSGQKDEKHTEVVEMVRKLRRFVEDNAHYVGNRFPEEARRIHYKEVEQKAIYGEASLDEAKSLAEEGIEVQPLPKLPEDTN